MERLWLVYGSAEKALYGAEMASNQVLPVINIKDIADIPCNNLSRFMAKEPSLKIPHARYACTSACTHACRHMHIHVHTTVSLLS